MPRRQQRRGEDQLLLALACGATVEAAAQKAGLSERSVYRRLTDPTFCAKRDQLRAEMTQRTCAALTAAGTEAVRTLVDLMKPVTAPASRLGAARSVLEIGFKAREMQEVLQRIAAIEAQLQPGPRLVNGTES